MNILKVADIMTICRCGRAKATQLAKESGAIIPDRTKGQTILVVEEDFFKYLKGEKR